MITILCRRIFGSAPKFCKQQQLPRIHHGIFGIMLIAASLTLQNALLLSIGSSLVLSDLLHHFVVLWILTRSFNG